MKPPKNSSVEQHIANTKNLINSAEMFVSGAEDPKTLAANAENFISSAETHITSAEALVSSSKNYLAKLKQSSSTAEDHISHVVAFTGAADKIKKTKKG
ncbi:MAG: hypothetical protein V4683_14320 [Bacteroidota bacterium]